jgi:putative transcriptional regulator
MAFSPHALASQDKVTNRPETTGNQQWFIQSALSGYALSRRARQQGWSMSSIVVRTTLVDGHLVEIAQDGTLRSLLAQPSPRGMTEEEIMAAALSDPDAQPLTSEDMKRMKRRLRAFIIRRALDLTQEEFATRYRNPLGTLRDWEQGRTEPDATARAYLQAIAGDPGAVAKALEPKTAA